jgi:hypothetical protein
MAAERRSDARLPVRVQVVLDDERIFRSGATMNLSRAGALIEAEEAADVGTEVRLIPLVQTRSLVLEFRARVLRVDRRATGGYQMAIALRLTPEETVAIEELCASA